MARLEKSPSRNASLHRRGLLAGVGAALLAACSKPTHMTASDTPELDIEGLREAVGAITARAAPGVLGVGLMNLDSGETFLVNGDRPFPMQSVFKLPLAAAFLAEIEAGNVQWDETVFLLDEHLSPFSAIAEAWPGRREYSYRELFEAVVVRSDNTAADFLMKRIGGPGAVTAWLTAKRARGIRIDRYERELATTMWGMPSFRPDWRMPAAFAAARAAIPEDRRMAAMQTYLRDPRDTATPAGMVEFLQLLDRKELVTEGATRFLLRLMAQTQRGNERIRAGLPPDAFLAHRPGTSGDHLGLSTAHNDVGIFTLKDRRSYALAVFLSGATIDNAARDALIADVARAAVKGAR